MYTFVDLSAKLLDGGGSLVPQIRVSYTNLMFNLTVIKFVGLIVKNMCFLLKSCKFKLKG